MVENLPCSAGDTGSIPGLGRSPVRQISLCATTTEPTHLSLYVATTGALTP